MINHSVFVIVILSSLLGNEREKKRDFWKKMN